VVHTSLLNLGIYTSSPKCGIYSFDFKLVVHTSSPKYKTSGTYFLAEFWYTLHHQNIKLVVHTSLLNLGIYTSSPKCGIYSFDFKAVYTTTEKEYILFEEKEYILFEEKEYIPLK
jgi:hypothetical protein